MKKILLASTMLAAFATVADAETGVKISGYGRFGLNHNSADDVETTLAARLRFNIDATTETDSGAVFGGRIRIQSDSGFSNHSDDNQDRIGRGLLWVEYEGLRVEAGNVNTAIDSAALISDSEIGFQDRSYGDSRSAYFSYDDLDGYASDRAGIYASYTMSGVSAQISYIDPEHYNATGTDESEVSLALSYNFNDQFTVSASGTWNGAGFDGNDIFFIGGAYKLSDVATVGLNYIDEGVNFDGDEMGKTVTLYGNYKMDAVTVKGYVASNDADLNENDIAFGIGADYDLGGARLSGGIERGYDDQTRADLGVRFNF